MELKQKDRDALKDVLASNAFEMPQLKMSIYKNRRGRYRGIYLWCKADLGTCRIRPMFATTWTYELVEINDIKINVVNEGMFENN